MKRCSLLLAMSFSLLGQSAPTLPPFRIPDPTPGMNLSPNGWKTLLELKRLQLENEEKELQIERERKQLPTNVIPLPPTQEGLSNGMLNGRAWNSFTKEMRVFYVTGIQEGVIWQGRIRAETPDRKSDTTDLYEGIQAVETRTLVEGLNAFYSQPENIYVPAMVALVIIDNQRRGMSKNAIESFVGTARAIGADAPERK